tara:strand:+ start:6914 stop:7753 length:840 start_codon:yes stop_codon:yes gene_type:complete
MSNKKNELTTTVIEEEQLPAFMQGQEYNDDDNFDSSDVVIPRIKLLQGLSEEVSTYDEARIGDFWHTGMDIPLGPEFRFVVADRRKKYLLSAPLEDGQGILARADDAAQWDRKGSWSVKLKGIKQPVTWAIEDLDVMKSGLTEWGTYNPSDEDSPPAATLFYDYLVFLPDYMDLGPAVISLARSSIKKAKKGLNDKIQFHKSHRRAMQALVFIAKSVDDTSPSGDFKNWVFQPGGFVQDEALFNVAREHVGALSNFVIQGEAEEAQPDTGGTDTGEGNF